VVLNFLFYDPVKSLYLKISNKKLHKKLSEREKMGKFSGWISFFFVVKNKLKLNILHNCDDMGFKQVTFAFFFYCAGNFLKIFSFLKKKIFSLFIYLALSLTFYRVE
jgi:hypothetical protein